MKKILLSVPTTLDSNLNRLNVNVGCIQCVQIINSCCLPLFFSLTWAQKNFSQDILNLWTSKCILNKNILEKLKLWHLHSKRYSWNAQEVFLQLNCQFSKLCIFLNIFWVFDYDQNPYLTRYRWKRCSKLD